MSMPDLITKVTQEILRPDGSEVRIVATSTKDFMTRPGLHPAPDVYVLRRSSNKGKWSLCSKDPHPDAKSMSVDEYLKRGRSEMLMAVTHAEIIKVTRLIGQPMSALA